MYVQELEELEIISGGVGNRIDYVQGGGGNTSVKLDDQYMAVKASGYRLNQITPVQGYVIINYRNIQNFYQQVDLDPDRDYEKESVEYAQANVIETEGLKKLRPSVETGFHSILKKYVIHTHPVYANLLCCSRDGRQIAARICAERKLAFLWIPYINPGFCLTLKIKGEIAQYQADQGVFPEVIFMENHGLIVTAASYQKALNLHEQVNSSIRQYFKIKEDYPEIRLAKLEENLYQSETSYIHNFLKNNAIGTEFFEDYALYPDQLVYLNGSLAVGGRENKLNLDATNGRLLYKANYFEASTIEETLLGYIYVVDQIHKHGLELKAMTPGEIDFIKNWESEAYRKSLVKDLAK
jgi:rhamnose utilization protein RhaD (predicted bifunctional aldolase and dehydrogenase)